MHRPAEHYQFEDSKGYVDLRIHPTEDHFYLLQLASSEKGFKDQTEEYYKFRDNQGRLIDVNDVPLLSDTRLLRYSSEVTRFKRNSVKFGVQFGKIFNNIALRFAHL